MSRRSRNMSRRAARIEFNKIMSRAKLRNAMDNPLLDDAKRRRQLHDLIGVEKGVRVGGSASTLLSYNMTHATVRYGTSIHTVDVKSVEVK